MTGGGGIAFVHLDGCFACVHAALREYRVAKDEHYFGGREGELEEKRTKISATMTVYKAPRTRKEQTRHKSRQRDTPNVYLNW